MRFSRCVGIGFLLSIIWAVGAAVHTHNDDVERADHFMKFAYETCTTNKQISRDADLSSCEAKRKVNRTTWMEGSNKGAAFVALAPLSFAWLAVFILSYVIRAQIAGFRAAVPWSTLTRPKKMFVGFWALLH